MDATATIKVDEAILLLRHARDEITKHAITLADRIAKKTVRKYPWIDVDDLRQELLIPLPKWIERFNPSDQSKTSWSKYLYHKLNFYVKDVLRREDPVGIMWPQREQYPTWFRLGDQSGRVSRQCDSSSAAHGGDCPAELIGRTLECGVDLISNEEDQLWLSSLAGLQRLAKANRKRRQAAAMIDGGAGVCRTERLEFWDAAKGRVRFNARKSVSLASWIGHSRCQLTLW